MDSLERPFNLRARRPSLCPPWLGPIIIDLNCRTRILMVADGLTFGTTGFGLSETVSIVQAASTTDHPVEVTTASTFADPTADIQSFVFNGNHTVNGQTRTLSDYEEIWLFGIAGGPSIPAVQRNAIEAFMDNGGGVFATGDHNELGARLSSEIKRVRSMRKWRNAAGAPDGFSPVATPGGASGRIDTNVANGAIEDEFNLQSDIIPQRIYPRLYSSGASASAHELLQRQDVDGPISFLPDHPHEGLVVEPVTLDPAEFPNAVAPEIVAWGVSAGAGSKPAVLPKCFGIVGAYNGHAAGVGRISVDSTWHHFVNINLTGSPGGTLPNGEPLNGLQDALNNATPEFEQIKDYFQNIAAWLEPTRIRICFIIIHCICLLWRWPLVEELPPPRTKLDLDGILRIGQAAVTVLDQTPGISAATVVETLTEDLDLSDGLRSYLSPRSVQGKREFQPMRVSPLINRECVIEATLGSAIWNLANALPRDPAEAPKAIRSLLKITKKGNDPTEAKRLLQEGAVGGLRAVAAELGEPSVGLLELDRESSRSFEVLTAAAKKPSKATKPKSATRKKTASTSKRATSKAGS